MSSIWPNNILKSHWSIRITYPHIYKKWKLYIFFVKHQASCNFRDRMLKLVKTTMSLFQQQNKDYTELFIDIINSSVYIHVLAFWSYDYESPISMTQVAKMTTRQKIRITCCLLNMINVVSYSNYRFKFLAPFDTHYPRELTFWRIYLKEWTFLNLSWRWEF